MTVQSSGNSGLSGRWRRGGTELDITGLDWPTADATGLLQAIEWAQTRHQITPLTINGVPVAWITPPGPEQMPPVMQQALAAMDQAGRGDSTG